MTELKNLEDEELIKNETHIGNGICVYRLFRTFKGNHYNFNDVILEDTDEDFVNSVMWSMNKGEREKYERIAMVGYSQYGTKIKEVRI